jgi:hypothetical protein
MHHRTHTKSTFFLSILLLPLFLMAQDPGGDWEGYLVHSSCIGSRQQVVTKLNVQGSGNDRYGRVVYKSAFDDPNNPNPNAGMFAFTYTGSFSNNALVINYHASNEIQGRRTNFGYYIQGRYRLYLNYTVENGVEKLVGFYAGSNGGRGEMRFVRIRPGADSAVQSPSAVLAQLRKKQEERKLQQALAQKVTMPDTTNAFTTLKADPEETKLEIASRQKMTERQTDIIKNISISENNYVDITLTDIAVIDNDTISIFADSQLVAHRIRVSDKPIQIRIPKPEKSNTLTLRMVAENLGSIPPNTAMMVVVTRRQRFEVELKSDFKKSGSVLLKWED